MNKYIGPLIAIALLVSGTAFGVYAMLQTLHTAHNYRTSSEVYETVTEAAVEVEVEPETVTDLPEINFHSLMSVNEDVIGWLYCPDTAINYPVVQGGDNSYYLTHLIDGSEGSYGTLFMDCQSSMDDKNIMIYGHHMKDGSMFASLLHYQEQAYYEEHPVLYFLTPDQPYEVRLFAGFMTDANSPAYDRRFENGAFDLWLTDMAGQSDFLSDVIPYSTDQVLTLSTCAYSSENARYVVMGVLSPM